MTIFNVFFIGDQCDTHEDFPLPVGPRIALRPGLKIPLQDNDTQLSVSNSTWMHQLKCKDHGILKLFAFITQDIHLIL